MIFNILIGNTDDHARNHALSQPEYFGMTHVEAKTIQKEITETIKERWGEAADLAGLTSHESKMLKQATILSPACFF